MYALLGSPTESYSMYSDPINYNPSNKKGTLLSAANTAFTLIDSANSKDYVMGCSTGLENDYGLVVGHAYTLIGTYILNEGGKITKLIKIRNPWAIDHYDGNWNDNDLKRWTPYAK